MINGCDKGAGGGRHVEMLYNRFPTRRRKKKIHPEFACALNYLRKKRDHQRNRDWAAAIEFILSENVI